MSDSLPFHESAAEGAGKTPHPEFPDRWADGTLRPGNDAALVHGAYAGRGGLQAPLREEIRRRVLCDLGLTENDVTAALSGLVDRFAETSLLCSTFWAFLEANGGPIGARGRQRAAVAGYLKALDRHTKLATLIGLERRAKRAPSLEEVLGEQ